MDPAALPTGHGTGVDAIGKPMPAGGSIGAGTRGRAGGGALAVGGGTPDILYNLESQECAILSPNRPPLKHGNCHSSQGVGN